MATEVFMPRLGLTMEEGSIERWLKQEGDEVTEGETILEIMTDKVTAEVEAPVSGRLGPILFPEGITVPVGQVIAYVVAPGEAGPVIESPAKDEVVSGKAEARAQKTAVLPSEPRAERKSITASPVARRLARELGVDLSTVQGTGPKGRIVEKDVRRVAQTLPAKPEGPSVP